MVHVGEFLYKMLPATSRNAGAKPFNKIKGIMLFYRVEEEDTCSNPVKSYKMLPARN